MEVPAELSYSEDHEWVRQEGRQARVGITDFAQQALGEVVFVDLPEVGVEVEAGEVIGEVESTKSVSEIYAPLAGRVLEINTALVGAPGTLNLDCYGAGWICILEVNESVSLEPLLTAEQYRGVDEHLSAIGEISSERAPGGASSLTDVFCNRCGHRNPSGVNFCSSCGAPLSEGPDQTVAFIPDEQVAEMSEDDLGITPGELAAGTGVLVVRRGPDAGARFILGAAITHAGRHPDSEIFLDDITVSRRHAEFEPVGTGYRVRDVGSLNGTYVNRERIDELVLETGDEVQIGKFKLVFLTARA